MVLLWKQAELMRTTSNYGVYYSMYLSKRCSLCVLEILPCRFKRTSLQEVRRVFFPNTTSFLVAVVFRPLWLLNGNALIALMALSHFFVLTSAYGT